MHGKLLQSRPTLCNPMDYSLPGSSVHGILQARILEWVVVPDLQEIFPTQGSNLHLLRLPARQVGSLPLVPPGKPYMLCLVTQLCPTLCNPMDCSPPGSSIHGDSSGKNTGMSCHALFQGIFPTQGSNSGLPQCRWILYHLSHQGSPYISIYVCKYTRSHTCMY